MTRSSPGLEGSSGSRFVADFERSRWSLVVVLVAVVTLVACTGGGDEGDSPGPSVQAGDWEVDPTATAEVDHEAGTILLPMDRYWLTEAETAYLLSARSLAVNLCARDAGVVGHWEMIEAWEPENRRYGVWVRSVAERYGYSLPMRGDDFVPNNAEVDGTAVYEECAASDPDTTQFNFEGIRPAFDIATVTLGMSDAAFASAAAEEIFADWGACLAEHGLERDTSSETPWMVAGTSDDVTESNIAAAIVDVDCKASVDFIQRIADIEAGYEQPIVDEYQSEFEEMRAEYDAMLELARQYLDENAPAGD